MGQRKCAKDGCNRLEFRISGFCLKHKDSIVSRSKPESILIESSEIADYQSKKPGWSSKPAGEKKEQVSDKRSTKSESKGKKTDIAVKNPKEDNRVLTGLIGLFLFLFGFFAMFNAPDDACCFFLIMIVIGLSLITQSLSTTTEKKVGFVESLGSVLLILFVVLIIGFFILLYALSQF